MHILFVEDDEIITSGVVYTLQSEGWKITHYAGVDNAFRLKLLSGWKK